MKKYVDKIKNWIPGFKECKLKGIFVVIDGMADIPHKLLNNMTPLEAANTSNLDFLATRGELGFMYPVKPQFIPESDEALISIFGNDLLSNTRGQLEAKGSDLKLTRGDLALRVNFATIDSSKRFIIDRRSGRTLSTKESDALSDAIRKIKMPFKFDFIPTSQHNAVLVFRGGFSENITGNDLTYIQGKKEHHDEVKISRALDDDENTQYTSNVLNEFIERAHEALKNHPINLERKRKGLLPANYLLVRGPGIEIPKLKLYRKWVSAAYTPLEIGFSKVSGMKTLSFDYPQLDSFDSYGNSYEALRRACKFAISIIKDYSGSYNYVYIHIKETDLPGHDNKPVEKRNMLEYIDDVFFGFLRKFAPQNNIKIVVTADHATPCKIKGHSADPVPVLFYNSSIPKEKNFSEKESRKGKLGRIMGKDLLRKVGFVK